MSKIFEAVVKDRSIDFAELYPNDIDDLPSAPQAADYPIHPVSPFELSRDPIRVARLRTSALSPILPFDQGHHLAAEQYRIIRTKLLHDTKKSQLILVSSPSSGDGKTVTSINIAGALALKSQSSVLLVDADLRRPGVAAALSVPAVPGLTDVLLGMAELDAALIRAEQFPNLLILPAGRAADNPAELLDSPRWNGLLEQVRSRFENTIVDAPPIAVVADVELLQLSCDGVIIVIRPDYSDRAACTKALATVLERKLFGVVLNCVEDWWLWKAPSYEAYQKHSEGMA